MLPIGFLECHIAYYILGIWESALYLGDSPQKIADFFLQTEIW